MKKSEKLMAISHAYTTKKVEDAREEITIISEDLAPEVHEAIKSIQFKLNDETGTFELDYDIMSRACDILADVPPADLESADIYELAQDSASVYTGTRLGYLTINNQDEIAEIIREHECDTGTGAAVWYERQVARACELIREWVLA